MSKENLLKEFDKTTEVGNGGITFETLRNLFIKAIDQTREETIRAIPEEMIFNEETDSEESKTWIAGFNNCRNQILNKLKK